jgi:hypothetical protein
MMSGSFGVRPCRPDDRARILALLAKIWGGSDDGRAVVSRLDAQWEWRFARNPYADPAVPAGFVLEHGDAIVGHLSCMPVAVNVRGAVVSGFWPGEWVTDPEHGRGFGHLLMRRMMALRALGLATPNEIAYTTLKRLGWSDVYRLENRIRVVRPDRLLPGGNVAALAALGRAGARLCNGVTRAPFLRGPDSAIAIAPISCFDERFDELWRRVAPGYGAAVVRDRRFLAWRYAEIPDRRYAIAAALRGGEVTGYVVFYARQRRGLAFGHVIDLLVARDDPGARDALLAHAVEELERQGVDLVTCYLSPHDAFLRAGLRRCAFFIARRSAPVLARYGASAGGGALPPPHEWFLSRGDSDLDMAS